MKRISLILLVAALIMGAGINSSYALEKVISKQSSSSVKDLRNLNFWLRLVVTDKTAFKASTVISEDASKEITAIAETEHSVIYAYKGIEILEFLTTDFDRVFQMVANYLSLEIRDEKVRIWVMDFDTLQEIYPGQKNYPGGSPNTVAALYAPHVNYFFFTPRYMSDYYVAHELIHHFIDEYQEEVVAGLPEVISQQNTTDLSLEDFISQHEEEITVELSEIIIHENLASFAL